MNVTSRIEGSICGAILLRHRPSSCSTAAGNSSRVGRFGSDAREQQQRILAARRRYYSHESIANKLSGYSARRRGLPRCRAPLTVPPLRKTNLHDCSFFKPSIPPSCENHTATAAAIAPSQPNADDDDDHSHEHGEEPNKYSQPRTQEELLSLVDGLDTSDSVDELLKFFQDPYMRGYAPADGPRLSVASMTSDLEYPTQEDIRRGSSEEDKILWNLRFSVLSGLQRPDAADRDRIFALYQQLPEPRMTHLTGKLRHQLMKVLGQTDRRDSKTMLRYFSLVADIKNAGLALSRGEWNQGMALASRYVGRVTAAETESTLRLWREMEQEAGVKGNDVTFNILFDVASKSGNFALAEMIYLEMERRGHRPNRYHRVSLIHYFGLKRDSGGVRAAYREMVNRGEIIDTVVLNCVIASFLRCGEEASAEYVYERMKMSSLVPASVPASGNGTESTSGEETTMIVRPMPARTYATNKAITRVFLMFARLGRQEPDLKPLLQSAASLAPDLQTYRLLINHYGVRLGDLPKVAQFLDEMKFFNVPLHGAIFLVLFKGFDTHGGYPGSAWSERRLEGIWEAFLSALDHGAGVPRDDTGFGHNPDGGDETEGLHAPRKMLGALEIKTWLAMGALRAFSKCSTKDRVLDAYEALKARWDLDRDEALYMVDYLKNLLHK